MTPQIAVAHVSWTMRGAKSPDGNPLHVPQKGIQTQLLQKQSGAWLISALQNTNGIPEIPFPLQASPALLRLKRSRLHHHRKPRLPK
jgi:hypothetical protein